MGCFDFRVRCLAITLSVCVFAHLGAAQLKQNYYANVCPNVESIVRGAVTTKFRQTFVTAPATLRLFFHDCFVQVSEIYGSWVWFDLRVFLGKEKMISEEHSQREKTRRNLLGRSPSFQGGRLFLSFGFERKEYYTLAHSIWELIFEMKEKKLVN